MSINILPNEWVSAELDKVVTDDGLISDGDWVESKDQDINGTVRLIQLADIGDGEFKNKSRRFMTPEKVQELKGTYLKDGDILIARMPDPLGRCCIFPKIEEEAVTVVDVCLIRVNDSSLLTNRLLMYWINSSSVRNIISAESSGTTRKRITRKKLEKLTLPIPGLAEQKIIADKLDDLLARVESIKTRLENIPEILKKFRQSVLSAAVSGKLTEEWRKENESPFDLWKSGILNDFIQKPSYGSSSKSQSEGEIPVLRMGNLQRGEIDWTDLVYTSDPKEIEKYTLASGDVLFNRTNSPELVGKTSIYRGERNAIYAGYLIRVKVKDSLNSDFLNYHLNSPQAKEYCLSVKSDGVSQSNINAKKLSEYPISVPPYSEQLAIINKLENFFYYIDNIERKSTNTILYINNLTQSILAKAFRGELTAQWREENPELVSGLNSAEALLEKITAEKLAAGTVKKRAKKSSH